MANKLEQLKLMVFDEASMAGSPNLQSTNTQLCEILDFDVTSNTFGGVSVIAVGDLYQSSPSHHVPFSNAPVEYIILQIWHLHSGMSFELMHLQK